MFQKAAIEATDKIILIVDHSKFEKKAGFSDVDLSQFDYVISKKLFKPAMIYGTSRLSLKVKKYAIKTVCLHWQRHWRKKDLLMQ